MKYQTSLSAFYFSDFVPIHHRVKIQEKIEKAEQNNEYSLSGRPYHHPNSYRSKYKNDYIVAWLDRTEIVNKQVMGYIPYFFYMKIKRIPLFYTEYSVFR